MNGCQKSRSSRNSPSPLQCHADVRGAILKRDGKGVHAGTQALVLRVVLDKAEDGKVELTYDAVHVDFTISRAA